MLEVRPEPRWEGGLQAGQVLPHQPSTFSLHGQVKLSRSYIGGCFAPTLPWTCLAGLSQCTAEDVQHLE